MELKDKTVLITGKWEKKAAQALARDAAKKGAQIVLVNKTTDTTEPITREIRDAGKRAVAIQADVQSEAELTRMIQQTLAAFGRIDIVLHHWGRSTSFPIAPPAARATASARLRLFRCQQAVMPTLLRQGSGMILNVGQARAAPRPKTTNDSIAILLTRVKGGCLQTNVLGLTARDWRADDPAAMQRLGKAMGLADHPCWQVQPLPDTVIRRLTADNMTASLITLISEMGGEGFSIAREMN